MDNRKETAEKIITALTNRSGFNDLWYNLDEEIQTEITDEIVNILPIQLVVKSLPDDDNAIIAIKQQLKDKGYRNDV
jgi:hypothetical protein